MSLSDVRLDGHPQTSPQWFGRPDVANVLNMNARLTVLCAPTGYGKTVAVAQWLGAGPDRLETSAWVSLAGMDTEAIRDTFAQLLKDPRLQTVKALVIDDLYPTSGVSIHDLVSALVNGLPCRVVVITSDFRTLPEFAIARLGGVLIGEEQLSLGQEDVERVVALFGNSPKGADPLEIHRVSLGWPRAVMMLALMRTANAQALRAALDVYIDDELLSRITASNLVLLEATAASTWIDRGVVGLLAGTGQESFDSLVRDIMARGMATVSGAGADMRLVLLPAVRSRLIRRRAASDPATLQRDHVRMAHHIDPEAHPDVAIYHAVEARDWDLTIAILDGSWAQLFFEHNTIASWALASLPASIRDSQLRLQAGLETALTARSLGADEESRHIQAELASFTRITGTTGSEKSRPKQTLRDTAIFEFWRMVRARHRWHFEEASNIAKSMRIELAPTGRLASKLEDFGPLLFVHWGISALLAVDFAQARTDFEAAFALGPTGRVDFMPRNAVGCLALMDALDGDIPSARTWLERAKPLRKPSGRWSRIAMASENVAASLVALSEGRIEDALEHVREPIDVADQDEFWAVTLYARTLIAQKEGTSLSILAEILRQQSTRARSMSERGLPSALAPMAEAEARLSLGQPGRAKAILDSLPAHPAVRVLRAQAQYALGHATAAIEEATTAKWSAAAGPAARTHAAILCLICHMSVGSNAAVVADAKREVEELVTLYGLERAWTLVDDDARVRLVADYPELAPRFKRPAVYPVPILQDPLSPRETAVLTAIAHGASVETAARELFVSANTVRTQLKAVYRKLGVNTRADAIAVAARRGLISDA